MKCQEAIAIESLHELAGAVSDSIRLAQTPPADALAVSLT
jgi:hypothetical protein